MFKVKGFTFIEMLLASAVFAMVGMASVAILSNVTQSDEVSRERLLALQQLQFTMLIFERDLMQMTSRQVRLQGDPPQEERLWGEPFLLGSDDHGISFTRQGWRNPGMLLPRSEVQAVAYRLQNGELQRLFTVYVDAVNDTTPQQQVLLKGVNAFSLEYRFNDRWLERWHHRALPQAIRLKLSHQQFGEIERLIILPNALWREADA